MKNLSLKNITPFVSKSFGVFLFSLSLVSTPVLSKESEKKSKPAAKKETKPLPRKVMGGNIRTHSIGIGLGQTFLTGDFNDNGEDKITADLYYAFKASHSFDFLANFHTSEHKFQDTSATITGLALGIRGRAYQFDAFAPYAIAGLGFYQPQVKRRVDNVLLESEEKIIFGAHLGAGADLQLNEKVSAGIVAHYHNPFDVKQDVGPEVEGSYFKLLLTALFHF